MKNKFKYLILTFLCLILPILTSCVHAFQAQTIPIVMTPDNNYIYPTLISMASLMENKNEDTYIEFYIIIPQNTTKENINRIHNFKKIYNKCNIIVKTLDDSLNTSLPECGWPPASLYRLYIASLLPHYNKAIYIDGDTLVRKDLCQLYNIDMTNYYIGGTIDVATKREKYKKAIGMDDSSVYINSGVLLMNLKEIRENDIERKFTDYLPEIKKRNLPCPDQDLLNVVCQNKIKIIPLQYNSYSYITDTDNIDLALKYYSQEQIQTSISDPTIKHYPGCLKPWNFKQLKFYEEWNGFRNVIEAKFYKRVLENGIYTIYSAGNQNKILDIIDGKLKLVTKNTKNIKNFKIKYLSAGFYEIEFISSGKVLDVKFGSRKPGTPVQQYIRNHSKAQKWLIEDTGDGYLRLMSKCNGLFLDTYNENHRNDSIINVRIHHNGASQKFRFVKA